MKYDKAELYQPVETQSHFWSKLRLDLWKDGELIKSIEDRSTYFVVDKKSIKVHSYGGGGQMSIPLNGPVRFEVDLSDVGEFIRGKQPSEEEQRAKIAKEERDLS